MALSQNSNNIASTGSGRFIIYAIDKNTGCRTSQIFAGPWLSDSNLNDDQPTNTVETEGSTTFTTDGVRAVSLELNVMQRDKASIDFIVNDYRDSHFVICKEMNEDALNGNRNYLIVPNARPKKSLSLGGKSGEYTYGFDLQKPQALWSSIALTQFTTTLGLSQTLTGTISPATTDLWYIQEFAEA